MIIFNGEIPTDSILTDAILLGDGVFETLRSYEGKLFALDAHLNRLEQGVSELSAAGTSLQYDRESLVEGIAKILRLEAIESGALRISVYSAGNWVLSHKRYEPPSKPLRCTILKGSSENLTFKSASYAGRLRLRRLAQGKGFDDAILSNEVGEISELATANLLAFIDGQWTTPRLSSGALPGITRRALIDNFGVVEKHITSSNLEGAESVAALSSLREIQGIKEIDGKDTPISNRLRELQESFHSWILGNLAL